MSGETPTMSFAVASSSAVGTTSLPVGTDGWWVLMSLEGMPRKRTRVRVPKDARNRREYRAQRFAR